MVDPPRLRASLSRLRARRTEVDDRRVHQFLRQDLDDLDGFIVAILDGFPELESK